MAPVDTFKRAERKSKAPVANQSKIPF